MSVGLVAVSHSERIAHGVVELAAQMAGSTSIVAAGGTDDGGIGTSFDKVSRAIEAADSGHGVVILTDLGSAVMTAELAVEFLDEDRQTHIRIVDAPLVEGAVAAAVAAETGGDLDCVVAAAKSASGSDMELATAQAAVPAEQHAEAAEEQTDTATETVTLINPSGLHARPAADFVKLAATFESDVTVNGVSAKSLLRIMALGLTEGSAVDIAASGSDAAEAVAALRELVASGFGEL